MIGGLPIFPDGSDRDATHARWVTEELTARRRPGRVDGVAVSQTSQGDFLIPEIGSAGGQGRVKMYILRDVKDDYLVCHTWDGTNEGTKDIYIAKEKQHRTSRTGDTLLNVDHTYTYSDGPSEDWDIETATRFNKIRHNNDGSTTEDQRIVEPWKDGEVFNAIPAMTDATRPKSDEDSTPVKITLLIIGRTTMWGGPAT